MRVKQTKNVHWRSPKKADALDVLKVGTEKFTQSPLQAPGIPRIGAATSIGKVVSLTSRPLGKDKYEIEISYELKPKAEKQNRPPAGHEVN